MKSRREGSSPDVASWWQDLWKHETREGSAGLNVVCVHNAPMNYNRFLSYFQKLSYMRVLKQAGSLRGRRVLDVGCGIGRWTTLLHQYGAQVVGLDIAIPQLRINRERFVPGQSRPAFVGGSLESMPFPDDLFDFISSITVLQHLPFDTQDQAIENMARCTRNGGWILIQEKINRQETTSLKTSLSFPRFPEEWTELFRRNNCELLCCERTPLMPLFAPYWRFRDAVRKTLQRRSRRENSTQANQPHGTDLLPPARAEVPRTNRLRKLLSMFGRVSYWLLTWPSWPVELLIVLFMGPDRYTKQMKLGAHQTFLFRKRMS